MNYIKIVSGPTVIEFHNSLWGEETVEVNGQIVSKQKSFLGVQHFFTVNEDGEDVRYVLVSKIVDNYLPALDLFRNGIAVQKNVPIAYGEAPANAFKKKGINLLNKYKVDEALEQFNKAKDHDPFDAEIYLYLACVYSLKEDCKKGFEHILIARQKNLSDLTVFEKHDMLAFLRIQEAFEDFKSSDYTKYDAAKLPAKLN